MGNLPPDVKEKEVDDLFYKVRPAAGVSLQERTLRTGKLGATL